MLLARLGGQADNERNNEEMTKKTGEGGCVAQGLAAHSGRPDARLPGTVTRVR
jgi:hypothetical protein